MNKAEIKNLIRIGFENPAYFKRGTWVKSKRIMDYLVKKGLVKETVGPQKYSTLYGHKPVEEDIEKWAEAYIKSPFMDHIDELRLISKRMRLPINDCRVLKEFMNTSN